MKYNSMAKKMARICNPLRHHSAIGPHFRGVRPAQ